MGPRSVALLLAGMLAVYLVLLGRSAVLLIASGTWQGVALGVVILFFPVLGAVVIYRELRFGFTAQAMTLEIQKTADPGDPEDPDAPDFAAARRNAADQPRDWRAWYGVASAYDAAGDRKQARGAMQYAARLYRSRSDGSVDLPESVEQGPTGDSG